MTFVNPKSTLAIGILFLLLDIIAVGVRFFVRRRHNAQLKADDWLCFGALVRKLLRQFSGNANPPIRYLLALAV